MESKTINLQELAISFLHKLDDRYTPEEQAQILEILNNGIDTFGDVVKELLNPSRREELITQAKGLFEQHKDKIHEIGFQIDEFNN